MARKLIYFSLPWCDPCRTFKPIMESLQDQIPIQFVGDEVSPLYGEYFIRSVPTVVLIENGKEINRFIGVMNQQEVINFFNQ
jgi:thioredoxin-like negative regulator of GroEL